MTHSQMRKKAIQAVNTRGCLLVFPLNNRREPRSLWSELFPRTRMVWEWDEDGDSRVADLWHLRTELSRSRRVVYSKWYQGRATLFSFEVFTDLLAFLGAHGVAESLSGESRNVFDLLCSDSPLSTKQLKAAAELEGRLLEPTYNRAMKPLWRRLLTVGFGEFEDSSFPSLGIGATPLLFEDLWLNAANADPTKAEARLKARLGEDNLFFKYARKVKAQA